MHLYSSSSAPPPQGLGAWLASQRYQLHLSWAPSKIQSQARKLRFCHQYFTLLWGITSLKKIKYKYSLYKLLWQSQMIETLSYLPFHTHKQLFPVLLWHRQCLKLTSCNSATPLNCALLWLKESAPAVKELHKRLISSKSEKEKGEWGDSCEFWVHVWCFFNFAYVWFGLVYLLCRGLLLGFFPHNTKINIFPLNWYRWAPWSFLVIYLWLKSMCSIR